VTGFTVAVPAIVETAMVGSAIAAGTGIGAFPDFAAGCRTIVRIEDRFTPDPAHRAVYDALYATYVELYPALRPIFRRLAELDHDGPA
jgi:L-xylulokinase